MKDDLKTWCAHKSFTVVTFSGVKTFSEVAVETGKWGDVVFVQIETAEVYFPTQRYIWRPQRCIFKLRPLSFHTPVWRQPALLPAA